MNLKANTNIQFLHLGSLRGMCPPVQAGFTAAEGITEQGSLTATGP